MIKKRQSLSSLKQMISICEEFAKSHSIVFNPSKTKLLCFNLDPLSEIPPIYLNVVQISIVEHEKHLGNYISTNISDRNIIANVCDLYQRSNLLISGCVTVKPLIVYIKPTLCICMVLSYGI